VFLLSFISKVRDFDAFADSVTNFQILQGGFVRAVAVAFIIGEFLSSLFLFLGLLFVIPGFLIAGFGLAISLLISFTIALVSVLMRDIRTPCNCFGTNNHDMISVHDVIRNLGLIAISIIGLAIASTTNVVLQGLSWQEWCLVILIATGIILFWLNLKDILKLVSG
jgi:hypothetical protein